MLKQDLAVNVSPVTYHTFCMLDLRTSAYWRWYKNNKKKKPEVPRSTLKVFVVMQKHHWRDVYTRTTHFKGSYQNF